LRRLLDHFELFKSAVETHRTDQREVCEAAIIEASENITVVLNQTGEEGGY